MVFDISSNVVAEQPGDPAARGRRSSQHKPPPHGDATQTRKPAGKTALQKKKKKKRLAGIVSAPKKWPKRGRSAERTPGPKKKKDIFGGTKRRFINFYVLFKCF